ncbi:glycosyltransferase family 2 protein [Gemmatimonas sp.]|uniref:glycosyltransferase family 2 protein n=1 Tax=Gemmatimonas sp. TaxID=1962908 RepID=UPI003565389C
MNSRIRLPGVSFCIITDGRRHDQLLSEIASIRALQLPDFEIIVSGTLSAPIDDITFVDSTAEALAGRLGAMRNRACAVARFDRLVVADDDLRFHRDFAIVGDRQLSYDVLCVRLLNIDGTRYWDWATHGGPRGHSLLAYDETDSHVYVCGCLAVMDHRVHDAEQWAEDRGFYQAEDVEWSERVRAAGFRIEHTPLATVTHRDERYTQRGLVMAFRQDLLREERIAPTVTARGFFRPIDPGMRWMSTEEAVVTAAAADAPDRILQLSLASVAPALAARGVDVTVQIDSNISLLRFRGQQSLILSVPLSTESPTRIRLTSSGGDPASTVGLDDPRFVSVLLHDVCVADSPKSATD